MASPRGTWVLLLRAAILATQDWRLQVAVTERAVALMKRGAWARTLRLLQNALSRAQDDFRHRERRSVITTTSSHDLDRVKAMQLCLAAYLRVVLHVMLVCPPFQAQHFTGGDHFRARHVHPHPRTGSAREPTSIRVREPETRLVGQPAKRQSFMPLRVRVNYTRHLHHTVGSHGLIMHRPAHVPTAVHAQDVDESILCGVPHVALPWTLRFARPCALWAKSAAHGMKEGQLRHE